MTSPAMEPAPNASDRMSGSRILTTTLILAIMLYAGLFAANSIPFVGVFVWIYGFCAFYFWVYIGVPAAITVFPIAFLASRKVLHKRTHRLRLGVQLSAITFALVGIFLMAMAPLVGGHRLHMGGYRLHVRLWLDADQVRAWASRLDLSQDSALSPVRWPLTVRVLAGVAGRVRVDDETRDVTIEYGSALTGHWGVHISARGKDWAGESSGHGGVGDWMEKLDDGVWIWSTMN